MRSLRELVSWKEESLAPYWWLSMVFSLYQRI